MVQALGPKIQGNSWICLGCCLGSCRGLWGDPSLSDIVHASYNTHKTVGCHIYMCVIILLSLYHWWCVMVQALGSFNIQGNSWACLWCSWKSCGGLRGDPSLSDIVHASYNTHKTVGCHIYMCAIILVSLYHWWGVMVQDLGSSNIQGISWVYHWCSWRSCRSLQGDPPLTDVVYASYNTYKTVVYHIHQCIINLGPLWLQH